MLLCPPTLLTPCFGPTVPGINPLQRTDARPAYSRVVLFWQNGTSGRACWRRRLIRGHHVRLCYRAVMRVLQEFQNYRMVFERPGKPSAFPGHRPTN